MDKKCYIEPELKLKIRRRQSRSSIENVGPEPELRPFER